MSGLAITNCRVSSSEQLENNSLNRQQAAVLRAAKELGVTIPNDGQWSGSVSSKAGTNVHRKDIKEMLEYCKTKKGQVKYLIVDEPDRFMRSIKEAFHFEVEFELLGVRIWYASDPELNTNDMKAKMMQFVKYFAAEGSNEERIKKSISGGQKAIEEGRLPSGPKAGYRKGVTPGVHQVDPLIGPPLRRALKQIASHAKTPTDALKDLLQTEFGKKYSKYKMDKFRTLACEPYYAGIIDLKGKFNTRNENGLHEPLISRAEHQSILRVFEGKPKNQQGHRIDKDTEFPLSNELTCASCDAAERKYPRFTSAPLNNGKTNHGKKRKKVSYYRKYRCRECNRYLSRDEVHESFSRLLDAVVLPSSKFNRLRSQLISMHNSKNNETKAEIIRLQSANNNIQQSISRTVDAITDPNNSIIRDELMASIKKQKQSLKDNEAQLDILSHEHENDLGQFLDFAFGFLSKKGSSFFELSGEDMKRCKQLIFTGKIYVDADKNVYTHEISPIFRGRENKKDTGVSSKSKLVRVQRL